jgi:mannosyltransferase
MDPKAQMAVEGVIFERLKSVTGGFGIAVLCVIIAGLAARLYDAGYNFDGDEVFSVRLAGHRLSEVIALSLADRPHPPLYNVVLHFWISLFGASELAARSLSVASSFGFLASSIILLRRLVSQPAAIGALLLLSISPFFVYYGIQARPYALIALLAAVNLYTYLRLLEDAADRKRVIAWALSCALLIYLQYLAGVVIGLEILFALLSLTTGRLRILVYGALAALLIVPWALAAMGHAYAIGSDPMPEISWMSAPTPTNFAWFYVDLFGLAPWLHAVWLTIALAALATPYAIRSIRRRHLPTSHVFLLILAFGAPLLCYVISILGPKPIFAGRQMMSAALSVALVAALCLDALPRSLAFGFIVALTLWITASLPEAFPQKSKPPWRETARTVNAKYGSADVFTEEQWVYIPLSYYRTEGRVLLWHHGVDESRQGSLLVVCRPVNCQDFESAAFAPRRSLIATWTYGTEGQPELATRTLHLYEIAAQPQVLAATRAQ